MLVEFGLGRFRVSKECLGKLQFLFDRIVNGPGWQGLVEFSMAMG